NYLICLGLLLLTENLATIIIVTLLYIIYYERIIFAEEAFLREKFGEQFTNWAQNTPMIIPKFSLWKPPERKFSIKEVLRREYTALLGIAISFVAIKVLGHYFEDGKIKMRMEWLIFILISLIIYILLRSMKKYTKILNTNE
ncbi:MAG TPA: methyltransferase, partial [Victivallales bacterium]|nr:methyltransferase [Victivallales bacterium]